MADPYPNVDEFGRGSCTCGGTMTGCAVCSTADILLRYGKSIPRLADNTPDMRRLGAAMGARHRAAEAGNRHGLSLQGHCTGGTNWCTYCAFLQLRHQGLPARHRQLSWAQIEAELAARHPMLAAGMYSRVPVVSESSYSSTKPARGRSDAGFTAAHMVVYWQVNGYLPSGAIRDFAVSDPDFGSPSRPTVPPHSVWTRAVAKSFWGSLGWSVCYVDKIPPTAVATIPWWGSDVPEALQIAYSATRVGSRLRQVGVSNYGKAINKADLEAGLRKLGIDFGTSVQLVDLKALMRT